MTLAEIYLQFDGVCVDRQERRTIDRLDCIIQEHRVGVIGANGSGKSTFARLINGLVTPSEGHVKVTGLDIKDHLKDIRRKVGFVFQNPDHQIVFPIVSEDIELGLKSAKLSKVARQEKIDEILLRFNLSHLRERSVHSLSGGEKQMIALSSVLVMEPEIIVLDEPTTLLDLRNKNQIMKCIDGLPQNVIMVTHDLDLLGNFDRVLVIDQGRIVADDEPIDAIKWYRKHLG